MTPAQRTARQQAALDRIFERGQQLAATWPPMSDEQIEHVAFLINPRLAPMREAAHVELPQAA
jgi:hypothetical protein